MTYRISLPCYIVVDIDKNTESPESAVRYPPLTVTTPVPTPIGMRPPSLRLPVSSCSTLSRFQTKNARNAGNSLSQFCALIPVRVPDEKQKQQSIASCALTTASLNEPQPGGHPPVCPWIIFRGRILLKWPWVSGGRLSHSP